MAYTKTTWLDKVVQYPMRFFKSGETSGGVTLSPDNGTVTQAGTPINAANLNKLEQGVQDAHTTADASYRSRQSLASNANFNTITDLGSYLIGDSTSHVNGPGFSWGVLEVHTDGTSYIVQKATQQLNVGTAVKYRTRNESLTWSAWTTIWTSGNDGAGSGLDADLFDGKDSLQFFQRNADGGLIDKTGGNANTIVDSGFYNGTNISNMPLSDTTIWWYLEVLRHTNANGYCMQRATQLNQPSAKTYFRIQQSSVWGAWQSMGGTKSLADWLSDLDIMNDGSAGAYSPVSNATLTSGIYRYSSLNIPAGVTITPSSRYLVLLVKGTATIDGVISASGKGGAGGTAVGGNSYGNLGVGGGAFGAGGGGGGGSITNAAGGGGGAGGDGNSGGSGGAGGPAGAGGGTAGGAGSVGVGGTAGSVQLNSAYGKFNTWLSVYGAGGGGGASGGTASAGNAGGAGGGCIIIIADKIIGAGGIYADGITGSTPSVVSGQNAGGGGGGGGGFVVALANSAITLPTMSANGAGGGTGYGGAYNGGSGGAGIVLKIER